jgi:hypothetical protein
MPPPSWWPSAASASAPTRSPRRRPRARHPRLQRPLLQHPLRGRTGTGEILLLLRGIPEKNAKCHRGVWEKLANRSVEARGKKLGIIGYGHIGTQLGIIAEMIGMKVYYYDIENKLSWQRHPGAEPGGTAQHV